MNKKELSYLYAKEMECTNSHATKSINALLKIMSKCFLEEEIIRLVGFGTFSVSNKKARDIKLPGKNQVISIPAKKTIKFTLSKEVKDELNAQYPYNAKKEQLFTFFITVILYVKMSQICDNFWIFVKKYHTPY